MSFIFYILQWFNQNKRPLPWRENKNPYHVWVSEVILQQTRVDQGTAYYLRFLEAFPTVKDLAQANEQSVLRLWQGLGYYSRARNMHKAAKIIVNNNGGEFPTNFLNLKKLPGIGPYTAAAIASICFNQPVPAIDGNAYRVYARYFGIKKDIAGGKAFKDFFELGLEIVPKENPGDFNEAIMELGAIICLPKNPQCQLCPIQNHCYAFQNNEINLLPIKSSKAKVQEIKMNYYFIFQNNKFLINHRKQKGIWKNMYDFPQEIPSELNPVLSHTISHILTHRKLNISFYEVKVSKNFKNLSKQLDCTIVDYNEVKGFPLPKPIEKFIDNKFNQKDDELKF